MKEHQFYSWPARWCASFRRSTGELSFWQLWHWRRRKARFVPRLEALDPRLAPAVTVTGMAIDAVEGEQYSGAIATVSGLDPNTTYTADWDYGTAVINGGEIDATFTPLESTPAGAPATPYVNVLVDGGIVANDNSALTVSDPQITLTGGFTYHGQEGQYGFVQTLNTVTDPARQDPTAFGYLSDYTGTINWGDGSTPDFCGLVYDVTANDFTINAPGHTYAEDGTYTITLSIQDENNDPVTVTNTAVVDDTPVDEVPPMQGVFNGTFIATEGQPSTTQKVAMFCDPVGAESLSDYSATINWGDGQTSPGTITYDSTTSNCTVWGDHTYADEHQPPPNQALGYAPSVTIYHDTAAPLTFTECSAVITDPDVTGTGGFTVTGTEGTATGLQTVATISDPGGAEDPSDYTATINWGDGTSSAGTITSDLQVQGSHLYGDDSDPGQPYAISVVISHELTTLVTVTSSAVIAAVPLSAPADSYSMLHDQALNGVVTTDDLFADNVTVTAVNYNSNLDEWLPTTAGGTVWMDSSGSFTYVAPPHYVGGDTFTYTLSDGLTQVSALVIIDITNQAPVANAGSYTLPHDQQVSGTVTGSDPDGDTLTVVAVAGQGLGQPVATAHGFVSMIANGNFTYTPTPAYVGSDSFDFTLTDGIAQASATITLTVTNQPPVAVDDSLSLIHDSTASGNVLANDSDPDGDTLTVVSVNGQTDLSQPIATVNGGFVSMGSDGGFTYTPAVHYVGIDSFSYAISDGAAQAGAVVVLDVTNQPPIANPDEFSVLSGLSVSGAVLSNDSDPDGDSISVVAVNTQSDLSQSVSTMNGGTVSMSSGGGFTYTAAPGFVGYDYFTYTISDGVALAGTTVTINVQPPPLVEVSFTATEGQAYSGYVASASNLDPNANYTATVNWGDQTTPDAFTVSTDDSGSAMISGTHTYADAGSYSVVVSRANASQPA